MYIATATATPRGAGVERHSNTITTKRPHFGGLKKLRLENVASALRW